MNSAVRRLLLFFFSFAALTACEDPTEIGLDLQDENLIGTEFTDTFTIQTGTVLQGDSILSYRMPVALAGQYIDPVLGTTRASFFSEVGLGGTNVTFGSNSKADSLVLTLDYSFKYADTLKAMQLNVHRLTSAFDERTSYFTNTPFSFDTNPIGSKAFQPRVEVVETNGTKSKKTKLLSIKLSSELANQFLAQSGQTTFADQTNFLNFFRGIALMTPQGENGSLIGFNLASSNSSLVLHYTAADGTKKQHAFVLGSGGYFSQITADRSGTALAGLQTKGSLIPSSATGGDSYVQAGTQLLTKVTIPNLAALQASQGNIIINRAELIFPVKSASTSNNLTTPPQLVLYETNSENRLLRDNTGTLRTVQQDGINPSATVYPAAMTLRTKDGKSYYSMNVTSYVQAITLGQKTNNGFLVGAAVVTAQQDGTRSLRPELSPYRTILTNNASNPVKLLIYYSKLK
ncbi:DUF4270 domain-containing protein [Pontibacter sp. JH31]|uniref:DUF4270 domain-containing protein n=1 Tax=Pontibacter aquaedesilientis TaxID=2766980 RepID=A0ABR7XGT1_9BACT|nr:DUF4270 domain-containing protein [Pontibacter aquaedesilientis]MBD1397497.1 DUF4270 domain-containing protein [Pontibacter aquaedesilientis]